MIQITNIDLVFLLAMLSLLPVQRAIYINIDLLFLLAMSLLPVQRAKNNCAKWKRNLRGDRLVASDVLDEA